MKLAGTSAICSKFFYRSDAIALGAAATLRLPVPHRVCWCHALAPLRGAARLGVLRRVRASFTFTSPTCAAGARARGLSVLLVVGRNSAVRVPLQVRVITARTSRACSGGVRSAHARAQRLPGSAGQQITAGDAGARGANVALLGGRRAW